MDEQEEFIFNMDDLTLAPEGEEIEVELLEEPSFSENLAESLSDEMLDKIRTLVDDDFTTDLNSRRTWEETIVKGLKLLGFKIDEHDNELFDGACTAIHPLLVENIIKSESRAIQEMLPAGGPVKTQIIGYSTPEAQLQARRVKDHMNYQLMEECDGYFEDSERLYLLTPAIGTSVRKCSWDVDRNRPDIYTLDPDNFVINNSYNSISNSERHTEIIQYSARRLKKLIASGFYRDVDLPPVEHLEPGPIKRGIDALMGFDSADGIEGYEVLEQHRYLDLDGEDRLSDGGAEVPYIVHKLRHSNEILAVYRGWSEDDPNKMQRVWYKERRFIPGFGFYGLGYIHTIGALTYSATAILRSLVDTGQFSNLPAGYKDKRIRISGDKGEALAPGEFRDVDSAMEDLSKGFYVPPFKDASQTLFALLQFIVEGGQKFADATEEILANSTNYGPVGTTLALLEASAKFQASIHKRYHAAMKEELRMLANLNKTYLVGPINFPASPQPVSGEDYNLDVIDVIPVSDPNITSAAQRLAIAQAQLELALKTPQIHDLRAVHLNIYDAMGVSNVEQIMPPPQEPQPLDPLSDLQAAMSGKPIRAFPGQNHKAHVAIKAAFLEMPQTKEISMSPTGQQAVAAIQANIQEHVVLDFITPIQAAVQQQQVPPQQLEAAMAQVAGQIAMAALREAGDVKTNEERMLEQKDRELDITEFRIDSQEVREHAKIAQKDRELDMQLLQIIKDLAKDDKDNKLSAAISILENKTKLAAAAITQLGQEARAKRDTSKK